MKVIPEIVFLAALVVVDGIAIVYSTYRYYHPKEKDEEWEERETQFEREELKM